MYIEEDNIYFYNKTIITNKILDVRRRANEKNGLGNVNDICPFCKNEILLNDEVYFSISNTNKIIPNKIVHASCVDGKSNIELMEEIIKLKEEYKSFLKVKRIWE